MEFRTLQWLSVVLMLGIPACTPGPTESEPGSEERGLFEQTDVFVAGEDGIVEYRIPVLVTSNKGTLLAFCDARVDKPGDPPNNIDLVMKRSTDQGRDLESPKGSAGRWGGRNRGFLRPGRPANRHNLGLHSLLPGGRWHQHCQARTVRRYVHVLGHQER